MIQRRLRSELSSELLNILTSKLFVFKESASGITEKVNLLSPEERKLRRRFYRNRQVAPKRLAQRIDIQRESLIDCQKLRDMEATEELIEIKKEQEKEILARPTWQQLMGNMPIEYFR